MDLPPRRARAARRTGRGARRRRRRCRPCRTRARARRRRHGGARAPARGRAWRSRPPPSTPLAGVSSRSRVRCSRGTRRSGAVHALPEPPGRRRALHARARRRGPSGGRRRARALLHPGGRTAGTLDRIGAAAGYVVAVGLAGAAAGALLFDPPRVRLLRLPGQPAARPRRPRAADWLGALGSRARPPRRRGRARRAHRRSAVAAAAGRRSLAAPVAGAAAVLRSPRSRSSAPPPTSTAPRPTRSCGSRPAAALAAARRRLRLAPAASARGSARVARPPRGRRARRRRTRCAGALGRALGDPACRARSCRIPRRARRHPRRHAAHRRAAGRARTAVERRGEIVAWVEHRADLRATPDLPRHASRPAGLTLERESLRAAQRLQAARVARIQPCAS